MRSQTPLALMEQMVMLLVFALAAVLCVQAFVWAEKTSIESEATDRAAVEVQTAAEILKSCHGDMEKAASLGEWESSGEGWAASYNGDWQRTEQTPVYTLNIYTQESGQPGLGQAALSVTEDGEAEALYTLSVCWQEVSGHD